MERTKRKALAITAIAMIRGTAARAQNYVVNGRAASPAEAQESGVARHPPG
jgi:hypothetical protein